MAKFLLSVALLLMLSVFLFSPDILVQASQTARSYSNDTTSASTPTLRATDVPSSLFLNDLTPSSTLSTPDHYAGTNTTLSSPRATGATRTSQYATGASRPATSTRSIRPDVEGIPLWPGNRTTSAIYGTGTAPARPSNASREVSPCNGCTVHVSGAGVSWWYPYAFRYPVATFRYLEEGSVTVGYTMIPAATPFDLTAEFTESMYIPFVTYNEFSSKMQSGFQHGLPSSPVAASTTIASRDLFLPIPTSSRFKSQDEIYLEIDLFGEDVPATALVTGPTNTVAVKTSATPFVVFSNYQLDCNTATKTIDLAEPFVFDHWSRALDGALKAEGRVPDAFLEQIEYSNCVPGTWSGSVTVVIVVDVFIIKGYIRELNYHTEVTQSFLDVPASRTLFVESSQTDGIDISHSRPGFMQVTEESSAGDTKNPNGEVKGDSSALPNVIPVGGEAPGKSVGKAPAEKPGNTPGNTPGNAPGRVPGDRPGNRPDNRPGNVPGNVPGRIPANRPGNAPGNAPVNAPDRIPGNTPGSSPDNAPGRNVQPIDAQPQLQSSSGQPVSPVQYFVPSPNGQTSPPDSPVPDGRPGENGVRPAGTPVIVIGENTFTMGPSSTFVIGGQTLAPGGSPVTYDGTSLSLAASATALVVEGDTLPLVYGAQPGSPGNSPLPSIPRITPPPLLNVGGVTYTAERPFSFVVDGETLAPGDEINIGTDNISLGSGDSRTVAVVNGIRQTLDAASPAITIDGESFEASYGSEASYFVGGQSLTPGGIITVAGNTISLGRAASSSIVVINGVTQTLAPLPVITPPPVLPLDGDTIIALSGSQPSFLIDGQTLTLGGSVVVDGVPVSLGTSDGATILVVDGITRVVPSLPTVSSLPTITINGKTYTALQDDSDTFVIEGQTLTPGGTITVSGTTIALPIADSSFLVVDGVTSAISTASITAPLILTFGNTVHTALPLAGTSYVISGQTLTPGGVITVSGTVISLSDGATALVVDGTTTTLSQQDVDGPTTTAPTASSEQTPAEALPAETSSTGMASSSKAGAGALRLSGACLSLFLVWTLCA